MPYINDVFISYKRGRINEQWMEEIFLPLFESYLNDALPYEPKIFIDKTGLTPGVDFENELFKNLIFSKCLLSIWSPPYFRKSEWCLKEFLTMKYCEEFHELSLDTLPPTLIWPIMYRKIDPIPEVIQRMSFIDYSEFNLVGEAFFKSEKYLKFQERLTSDTNKISNIILNAPPLNPKWETQEGRSEVVEKLNNYFKCHLDFENPLKQTAPQWKIV